MNSAGCTAFGLHLHDTRNRAPDVFPSVTRPLIAEFAHRRSRRDRINRNDLARPMRNGRYGFIGINRGLLLAHAFVSVG